MLLIKGNFEVTALYELKILSKKFIKKIIELNKIFTLEVNLGHFAY